MRLDEETHDSSYCYCSVASVSCVCWSGLSQTTTATTSTTTTQKGTSSTSWPLGPFVGPMLRQTQDKNLTSVSHNREVRHESATWYRQLAADQKNAVRSDLNQAYSNWYYQLPQNQKDRLQSMLNQTSKAQ